MSKSNFVSGESVTRSARSIGLALLLALPALAQNGAGLTPPNVKGTLGHIEKAPTPKDQYGNPIKVQPPTAAEREATRKEEALRAEKRRAEEERQAVETRRATDERRAAERLAEEQRLHNQIMTAVYVGLAIMAVLVGLRLFKRS